MHHAPSAFLLVCALLLALSMPGRAPTARASHEATPVGETTFPITADPAACRVEPRSADDLIALWFEDGTPIAESATPAGAAAITEVSVPVGTPADAATMAAVTDTMREIFGCFAAGDVARGLWRCSPTTSLGSSARTSG